MFHGWLNLQMSRNCGYKGTTINYMQINTCIVQGLTTYAYLSLCLSLNLDHFLKYVSCLFLFKIEEPKKN